MHRYNSGHIKWCLHTLGTSFLVDNVFWLETSLGLCAYNRIFLHVNQITNSHTYEIIQKTLLLFGSRLRLVRSSTLFSKLKNAFYLIPIRYPTKSMLIIYELYTRWIFIIGVDLIWFIISNLIIKHQMTTTITSYNRISLRNSLNPSLNSYSAREKILRPSKLCGWHVAMRNGHKDECQFGHTHTHTN